MAKYGRLVKRIAVENQPDAHVAPEPERDALAAVLMARAKTCVVMWSVLAALVAAAGVVAGSMVEPWCVLVGGILGAGLVQYGLERAFWHRLEAHRVDLLAEIAKNTRR